MNIKSIHFFLHRIFHWEYWPQSLVYAPIFPIYLYYSAKAGTPFFVVAANPDIDYGGYMMESKFDIHRKLPENLVPLTIKILPSQDFNEADSARQKIGINFPFFCKPDVGGKGIGVEKIETTEHFLAYHKKADITYLIQEEITYEKEIGLFYCRLPDEESGHVTGIVEKKNMEVTGDGKKTLAEHIDAVPRFYYQRKYLRKKFRDKLNDVIPADEKMTLAEIGNHARGSMFIDVTDFNTPALEKMIDSLSKQFNTFYFGRYDIKFNSWEDLYEGENFMLIELNGSGSEPTHIYDPKKPLWQAWKIIIQHWKLLYNISACHHKRGVPYLSLKEGFALQKQEKELLKNIGF